MLRIIFLLLITSASFGQVLQETNGSRADNRNVFKLGFRLPQVCWVTGNPNLLNYSAFMSKGAMVFDTCAGKIKRWSGSAWISVADSMATGDTTGLGAFYIRNGTIHEDKRFSVQSGRLDSILAASSAGLSLYSNSGTQVGLFGAGGGSGATFYGGVNIDGTTRLNTGLTGVLIGTSGTVSATANRMVSTFAKNASRDSAILTLADGTRLAVRDSVGGGGISGSGASPQVAYWSGASTLTGSSAFAWNNTSKALYFDGVTPSAWDWTGANGMALEVPKASLWLYTDFAFLNSNVFFDGAYKRKAIGTTSQLYMGSSGVLGFRNAATGAANSAITWTDRLNILSDGKVGINTAAPPALLSVNSAAGNTNTGIKVTNTGTGIDVYAPIELVNNAGALSQMFLTSSNWTIANGARASGGGWTNSGSGGFSFIAYNAASDITFHTNTAFAERLRIDQNGGVNIGGTADAAASSLLEITSTTKGFLPPRMTTAQRNAIASPASGLEVTNTSLQNHPNFYNGTAWLGTNQQVGNEAITGNKTISATTGTHLHMIDATSGNVTITLPTMAAGYVGVEYQFIRTDGSANTVTIQRAGSNTINNAATTFTIAQFERAYVIGVNNSNTFTWHAGKLTNY